MYIRFTEEEKRKACEADLVPLLLRNGIELKRVGSEYMWMNDDQPISIQDNLWFNHYEQTGGNTIDFVKKFFGMNYVEAIKFILGEDAGEQIIAKRDNLTSQNIGNYTNCELFREGPLEKITKRDFFALPPRNENMNRAYAYLMYTRGIDRKVIYPFSHAGLLYEDAKYHNIVFVGTDKNGTPKHAHKKGTSKNNHFRANHPGSDARFTFNWRGKSDKAYIFEAPIDLLSFIELRGGKWSDDTYIAACSLSEKPLMQMLRDNPKIRQVNICFDNDGPGQEAAKRLQKQLFTTGYHVEILVPAHKDWNEDLLSLRQEEGEAECQAVSQVLS